MRMIIRSYRKNIFFVDSAQEWQEAEDEFLKLVLFMKLM